MNASVNTPAEGGARPGVLSLSIKEKSALFAAYMPFVKGGGLFMAYLQSREKLAGKAATFGFDALGIGGLP